MRRYDDGLHAPGGPDDGHPLRLDRSGHRRCTSSNIAAYPPNKSRRHSIANPACLGVSGVSADMRQVLAAASEGHQRARLAIDLYTHRVRQAIGALTVTMGGIDALIFTAGVGEHAAEIRQGSLWRS